MNFFNESPAEEGFLRAISVMKCINIQSIIQANKSLTQDLFEKFLSYYDIRIKQDEIDDLSIFVDYFNESFDDIEIYDNFYVSYTIPQIGKEFDLLRFGEKSVVSLEIKSEATEEKIKKQLSRNKYYLGFIGKEILAFSFISKTKELFYLDEDDNLGKVNKKDLYEALKGQKVDSFVSPDDLFNPSDYLVSPFNSSKRFLANEYFLTNQQEKVKGQILSLMNSGVKCQFISIEGGAGTGKTLLTFDIAKVLIQEKLKPLIIHCGQLNMGHYELMENGWSIVPIRDYGSCDFSDYDVIIVDEAQRIYEKQLNSIVSKVQLKKCLCIFSHDKLQVLSKGEAKRDASAKITSIAGISTYKLSEKIRSNKEVAAFVKMLFFKNKNIPLPNNGNISINYFNNVASAALYLNSLNSGEWEVLRFTPSLYDSEHHEKYSDISKITSHKVIGQEFENVVVTIDEFFEYDANGELVYTGKAYYEPSKMLFQNITRARKKINIVIINNQKILSRCFEILK